jgi:hypothetical protein
MTDLERELRITQEFLELIFSNLLISRTLSGESMQAQLEKTISDLTPEEYESGAGQMLRRCKGYSGFAAAGLLEEMFSAVSSPQPKKPSWLKGVIEGQRESHQDQPESKPPISHLDE